MATWVTLSGGNAWGINFEGVIYRTGYALRAYLDVRANDASELLVAT